jgi:hypothetical protein
LNDDTSAKAERYRIASARANKKDDVRRNDEERSVDVLNIGTETETATVSLKRGDFYVPLNQPLANLVVAALEPETQSSFVANRLLTVPDVAGSNRALLPLYRLMSPLNASVMVWTGD